MTEPPYNPDAPSRRSTASILNAKRCVAIDLLLGAINAGQPDLLGRAYRAVHTFHRLTYGGSYAVPAVGEVAALTTRFETDIAAPLPPGPVSDGTDEFPAAPSTGARRRRPA